MKETFNTLSVIDPVSCSWHSSSEKYCRPFSTTAWHYNCAVKNQTREVMTEVLSDTAVIIMHTYKINVAGSERHNLLEKLHQPQTVVLSETNSDNCYLIMPADQAETLLQLASELQQRVERITISELRKKYSSKRYLTLLGDWRLVQTLFR